MSKILRYQISDWSQITDCLSNNSKNLYLTLSKYSDVEFKSTASSFKGLVIKVKHTNYGTLFAAVIKGTGSILSDTTEEGAPLPFFTTEQILTELQRFGFYVTYDVKSNLPMNILSFLATVDNLGYDKITMISVGPDRSAKAANTYKGYVPTTIVFKSCEENTDILQFGSMISQKVFNEKLAANIVMNVSHEPGMNWDWVTYIANISDILDENLDPTDDFETDQNLVEGEIEIPGPSMPIIFPGLANTTTPVNYTVYGEEEFDGEEDDETEG